VSEDYPHDSGDDIVLGPQVFVSRDESVLNWKGRNYVPQSRADVANIAADAAAEAVGAMADKLSAVWVERDRLRAAIQPLRPYRVAIRSNDEFFAGAEGLADAILGAVAALDAEEGT
jgi:hypothetical protein